MTAAALGSAHHASRAVSSAARLAKTFGGVKEPTQSALFGAKTTTPLGVVAAPTNLPFPLTVDAIDELQLKVPTLLLCRARPGAGDIAPRLGRCNTAAAAAVAVAAVTISAELGPVLCPPLFRLCAE